VQDEESEKDSENAKKVHNILNGIKEEEKKTVAPSGPSMTTQS
jgi:hypothetical protein